MTLNQADFPMIFQEESLAWYLFWKVKRCFKEVCGMSTTNPIQQPRMKKNLPWAKLMGMERKRTFQKWTRHASVVREHVTCPKEWVNKWTQITNECKIRISSKFESNSTPSFNCIAAAAAKLLQSCPTLCDPIDGSPPGSSVPGILQARTLEWVAISFSNPWKWKVKVKSLSRLWLFETPWTVAYQAPPSVGLSRQDYWSGLPLPSPFNCIRFKESDKNFPELKSDGSSCFMFYQTPYAFLVSIIFKTCESLCCIPETYIIL